MQSGAQFPLTLTLSPREREQLSPTWEYSLDGEHFAALPMALPLPWDEGQGEGEGRFLLNGYAQLPPLRPQLARFQDPHRRDNAGDQLGRGDVEAGIQCPAGGVGHAHIQVAG